MINQYDPAYLEAVEKRNKRNTKLILWSVGSSIVLIVLLFLFFGPLSPKGTWLMYYPKTSAMVDENYGVLPVLADLPEYEAIDYGYKHFSLLIYYSDAVALKLKYDPKTYEAEKLRLDKEFEFLSEPVTALGYEDVPFQIIPAHEFKINSYTFRVISKDRNGKEYNEHGYSSDYDYPHNIGMVAYSDEKQSIAYLSFYDPDLDEISGGFWVQSSDGEKAMRAFVKEYFRMSW
jgi:hypothetical protein